MCQKTYISSNDVRELRRITREEQFHFTLQIQNIFNPRLDLFKYIVYDPCHYLRRAECTAQWSSFSALPVQPGLLQLDHNLIYSKQMFSQPGVGLLVAGVPGHWPTVWPPGKGPGGATYGQAVTLRRIHKNVVH